MVDQEAVEIGGKESRPKLLELHGSAKHDFKYVLKGVT